jgi:serine/threonine-protein kinase
VLTVQSRSQLPYLVMPYVDCESLQQRLDREGSLPVLDVLCIAHQVACGLAAAHSQGLVHRDVKPANILLERGVDRVMLTDFGLARAVDDATLTTTGLIAGTPQYMSPEQARGDSVDTQSDLFSLGSVMYAMSTGRPPFRAQTSYGILRRVIDDEQRPIGDLNAEIPAWLEGFINRLLAKQSESRFTSAEEVASLLQGCIAHVRQPQTNPLPAAIRELAERRKAAQAPSIVDGIQRFRWLLAALLAVIIGLIVLASGLFNRERPSGNGAARTPDQNTQPTTSITNEPPDDASLNWNDGVGEELQTLEQEMDSLLENLESND